jgi:hypothetical protein
LTTFNRVAGDKDTVVAYLYGLAAPLATPTGSEAHVWTTGVPKTTLTASTVPGVDPNNKPCLVCTVQLGTWLSAMTQAGTWFIEYQVTFSPTLEPTWPAERPDQIIVRAQG